MSESACPVCRGESRYLYSSGGHRVHRCRGCGLGFVADLPTPAELTAFYAESYYDVARGADSDAKSDAKSVARADARTGYHTAYEELEPGLSRMYREFLASVERRSPGKRFERVLDVGCAYGYFLDVAQEQWQPTELVGLDVSPEAHRITLRGHVFHSGFVEDVELPDEHFDLVFMGDAFEHVHDPIRVASKLARVLAPGGVLVLTTVDFDSVLARLLGRRWRLMKPPEHLFYWNRRSLSRVFGDRGLDAAFSNYWLYLPKKYVMKQFELQFGFRPFFLAAWPGEDIPIYSVDVLLGTFRKPG